MAILDVNVLVALAWPSHIHHRSAREWFDSEGKNGWATCPITQSGFIRVSSNPRAVDPAVSPREARALLNQIVHLGRHEFWPADLDFLSDSKIPLRDVMGYRQVTDAYLLGLTIEHHGILVTFDGAIPDLLPGNSPHRAVIHLLLPKY